MQSNRCLPFKPFPQIVRPSCLVVWCNRTLHQKCRKQTRTLTQQRPTQQAAPCTANLCRFNNKIAETWCTHLCMGVNRITCKMDISIPKCREALSRLTSHILKLATHRFSPCTRTSLMRPTLNSPLLCRNSKWTSARLKTNSTVSLSRQTSAELRSHIKIHFLSATDHSNLAAKKTFFHQKMSCHPRLLCHSSRCSSLTLTHPPLSQEVPTSLRRVATTVSRTTKTLTWKVSDLRSRQWPASSSLDRPHRFVLIMPSLLLPKTPRWRTAGKRRSRQNCAASGSTVRNAKTARKNRVVVSPTGKTSFKRRRDWAASTWLLFAKISLTTPLNAHMARDVFSNIQLLTCASVKTTWTWSKTTLATRRWDFSKTSRAAKFFTSTLTLHRRPVSPPSEESVAAPRTMAKTTSTLSSQTHPNRMIHPHITVNFSGLLWRILTEQDKMQAPKLRNLTNCPAHRYHKIYESI